MVPGRVLLCLGLALGGGDERDLVVLKDGQEQRGRVVRLDEGVVVLRQDTRDRRYPRAEVARVAARLEQLPALLAEAGRADLDAGALAALARRASGAQLPGEAEALWWRLLLLEHGAGREHEEARLALGHTRRGQGWVLPLGARRVDWEKRFELARDWGSAWELASLHFRLRTNLPLERGLDVLFDLERLYLAFQALLGRELELLDVCAPLCVDVHADTASYPEEASEAGRYDPESDVVHVDASHAQYEWTLAHELTHQLLFDTAFRERHRSGEIPAWLGEGLAEYVSGSAARFAPLVFEPGRPHAHHFRAQAAAEDPYELKRVLSFSVGDYLASSGSALKYAQSYTLVHLLLDGADGRYRAGFFDFLRRVYRGQGSATDLENCLDVRWKELDDEWKAHVRGKAF